MRDVSFTPLEMPRLHAAVSWSLDNASFQSGNDALSPPVRRDAQKPKPVWRRSVALPSGLRPPSRRKSGTSISTK